MDFFAANLAVLAQRQPNLARIIQATPAHPEAVIEPSRSGPPTLKLGNLRLTSGVDPVREGLGLAAAAPAGPLAALGFGLGYHLEPLVGRDLVVWEPDPRLLRAALDARDLSGLLTRLRLAVDPADLGDLSGRAAYVHPPSARLYPRQSEGLARRLDRPAPARTRPARPRVLVAPPVWGGSLNVAHWCAEALTALGCEVVTAPLDQAGPLHQRLRAADVPPQRLDRLYAPLVRFLGELTVLEAERHQPHLVLALAQAPLDRAALKSLRGLGAATAFWFVEDFRVMPYFREVAASYDFFFHIQGPELSAELERLGANHSFLPMAAHPPVHRPLALCPQDQARYGAVVGFMGAGYPNRRQFFARLVNRGLPLRLWGVDWPDAGPLAACLDQERYLAAEEVVKVYNACQMVLNLHSSPLAGRGPGGADFVNPRTLEVPACGGFMLVDRVQGLEHFLAPGREAAVFDGEDQLMEMVEHYGRYPEQRAAIAAAGRRRVLAQHTYYHRMEELLTRTLGQLETSEAAPPPGDAAAQRLLNLLAPVGAALN
ncbi:MAG: glycosyltransferase family protein [Thermodesulfobacteriota bacterium]